MIRGSAPGRAGGEGRSASAGRGVAPAGLWAAVALSGCGLADRADLLVGRSCDPGLPGECDRGSACLPHGVEDDRYADFRCRDAASFAVVDGREPPLAFCDLDRGLVCPPPLVCGVGRIRLDAGPRRPVCKAPSDPFGPPPEDAGPAGGEGAEGPGVDGG